MTDLDRVLRRVTDEPEFAARLTRDPRAALADYELSDADFAALERRMHPPAPASAGVGSFFAPAPADRRTRHLGAVAAAVGAIVLVGGGVGYALGSDRSGPVAGSSAGAGDVAMTPVAYSSCPAARAAATELGAFHRGDRVWVVGRDESNRWVQVRSPGGDPVWIASATVSVTGAERLPVVPCRLPGEPPPGGSSTAPAPGGTDPVDSELADASPTATGADGSTPVTTASPPGAPSSTTANGVVITDPPSGPTITLAPGTPAGPTVPGDRVGPAIAKAAGSPPDIWPHAAGAGGRCVTQTTSTVSASITDPSDVSGATVDWTYAGSPGQHGTTAMHRSGTTWSGTVGPVEWAPDAIPAGGADVSLTIRAVDGAGNASTATTTLHLHDAQECLG